MIVPQTQRDDVYGVTYDRREDADIGDKTVSDSIAGGHPEKEKSEQRAVGIAADDVYEVDDARRADTVEYEYGYDEKHYYAHVGTPSETLVIATAADVDAETSGQGRHGRVGARE